MLRHRFRTAFLVVAAASLALFGSATAASAATSTTTVPADCGVSDIGSPGLIYADGMYAGEVEQQYDGCGDVRAHFQYDSSYWLSHSGTFWSAYPCVQTLDYHGQACAVGDTVDGPRDVYSGWVPIHSASPDWWQAIVTIPGACSEAGGSWHDYGSGRNWGDYPSC